MDFIVGDVGGTHARLAVARVAEATVELLHERLYPSRDYPGLGPILREFLEQAPRRGATQACIGVAGPVRGNSCKATNLPWSLDGDALAREAGLARLVLLNDLEAAAWGLDALDDSAVVTLHSGDPQPRGNQAVIAAGTGLGEAGRVWCDDGYRVFASEGSHGDFAPGSELGYSLHQWLTAKYGGHVSWERVVSGPGLVDLHAFLREAGGRATPDWLRLAMEENDPAGAIATAAQLHDDPVCLEALDLFVCYFGAEAGNHALKLMATGGVYLAGGIAPKIASRFAAAGFLDAFFDKGRMEGLMRQMPVHLVTDTNLALYGAALCAARTQGRRRGGLRGKFAALRRS
jgi:glucokinase